jgi:peptidoglycan hydrolase-like protein with peptidoglycan-binding domain
VVDGELILSSVGETEKAVKKFQRDVGIDADGEVGRITWSRLF